MNQTIYCDKVKDIAITVEENGEGEKVKKVTCDSCNEYPDGITWEDFYEDADRYVYLMTLNNGQLTFDDIFNVEYNPYIRKMIIQTTILTIL